MYKKCICLAAMISVIAGCASRPETRAEYTDLPTLESGWGRMYISAGKMNGVKLWSVHQVGPVYINDKEVGKTAKDEYFAVDLSPGTYEVYCTQEAPQKNFIEKRKIIINAGDQRYFACDMSSKGAGGSFGLIGALASDYLTGSYLEERPMDNPDSKLVSYARLK